MLSDNDKKRIEKYYKDSLREYGPSDPRTLHWLDKSSQYARFQILANIADLSNKTILDVGCGTGELYKFFLDRKIPVEYIGIDIVSDLMVAAKERFPDGHFEVGDISNFSQTHPDQTFDYVLASGALSFKVPNNLSQYESVITTMYDLARKGLAFNMLNVSSHADDNIFAAYDPNQIADFCQTLVPKPRVEIVVDYLPQDFTIYLKKY